LAVEVEDLLVLEDLLQDSVDLETSLVKLTFSTHVYLLRIARAGRLSYVCTMFDPITSCLA